MLTDDDDDDEIERRRGENCKRENLLNQFMARQFSFIAGWQCR